MQARTQRLGERALIALLAALCLAAFGFAGRAEAADYTQVTMTGHVRLAGGLRLHLRSDSYRGREELALSVGRISRASSQYSYYEPPISRDDGPHRISAKLGERGSVTMKFQPRTERVVKVFGCDRYVITRGVLRGRLRFRGEQRYVDVDRKRMRARLVVYSTTGNCRQAPPSKPISLITCSQDGSGLFAGRLTHSSFFNAVGPERFRRGLHVFEGVLARSGASDFSAARNLESAKLTPPSPFTGSARYRDEQLTGDLAMRTLNGDERPLAPAKAKIKYGKGIGISCSFSTPAGRYATWPPGVISGRNPIAAIP